MQPSYRDGRPEVESIRKLALAGELGPIPMQWWGDTKPPEELYDVVADPDEIHNLAQDPQHQKTLIAMRQILDNWIFETGDKGEIPETATLKGIEDLRFIKGRWGDKCVNPEFGVLEKKAQPSTPAKHH